MEMSVREARARFATALAAAERGERVTVTRNGKPVAEIGPPAALHNTFSWEMLEAWRRANGFDRRSRDERPDDEWLADFNDPALLADFGTAEIDPDA